MGHHMVYQTTAPRSKPYNKTDDRCYKTLKLKELNKDKNLTLQHFDRYKLNGITLKFTSAYDEIDENYIVANVIQVHEFKNPPHHIITVDLSIKHKLTK